MLAEASETNRTASILIGGLVILLLAPLPSSCFTTQIRFARRPKL